MSFCAEPSDAELLAATGRDPEAFGLFYRRYERLLLVFMLRRTGDPELAADLTAEVFASALRAAGRYRPQAPTATAWLLTIAQRTLATSWRKGRVEARARRCVGIRDAVVLSEDDLELTACSSHGNAVSAGAVGHVEADGRLSGCTRRRSRIPMCQPEPARPRRRLLERVERGQAVDARRVVLSEVAGVTVRAHRAELLAGRKGVVLALPLQAHERDAVAA